MKKAVWIILVSVFLLLILTGCKKDTAPARTMEAYMTALSEKNEYRMEQLSCVEYRDKSFKMAQTLWNVDMLMLGLKCKVIDNDGSDAKVKCQADFKITQSNVSLDIDLAAITYQLKKVDDKWLVCGDE